MMEDLDLLTEDKGRKKYEFATLVVDIEKLPSPKDRKLALNGGTNFINVYKTFFVNQYE